MKRTVIFVILMPVFALLIGGWSMAPADYFGDRNLADGFGVMASKTADFVEAQLGHDIHDPVIRSLLTRARDLAPGSLARSEDRVSIARRLEFAQRMSALQGQELGGATQPAQVPRATQPIQTASRGDDPSTWASPELSLR